MHVQGQGYWQTQLLTGENRLYPDEHKWLLLRMQSSSRLNNLSPGGSLVFLTSSSALVTHFQSVLLSAQTLNDSKRQLASLISRSRGLPQPRISLWALICLWKETPCADYVIIDIQILRGSWWWY